MKKNILLLPLLICALSFYSQTKIDSLKNELKSTNSNKEKATINYHLAIEYYSEDLSLSEEYYEKALFHLNRTDKKDEETSRIYLRSGSLLMELGKFKVSDSLLDLSKFYAQKNKIKPLFYNINANMIKALNQFYRGKRTIALKMLDSIETQGNKLDSLIPENAYLKVTIGTNKAIVLANSGKLKEALKYFKIKMNYALKTTNYNNTSEITSLISSINNTALCSEMLDMPKKAFNYYMKALELAKKYKITIEINRIYINISKLFSIQSEHEKSIKYASLVNSTEKQTNFSKYNNIGVSYLNLKEYNKSIINLQKALKLSEEIIRPDKIALIHVNLGLNLLELKKINEAISHLKKAKEIYLKLKDNKGIAMANEGIARSLLKKKRYQEALSYALETEKYVVNSKEITEGLFKNKGNLHLIYKNLGNNKKALHWLEIKEKTKHQYDSIRYKKEIKELEIKYETQQKENQILKLSNENIKREVETKRKKTQLNYSLFGGASILLLSLFTFRAYRKEKKSKKQIEIQKKEIETLHRELHHRVKNNIAVALSFISVAKENIDKNKAKEALYELENRILNIASIHEVLYKQDNVSIVNLQTYIEQIYNQVSSSFNIKNLNIQHYIKADFQLPLDQAMTLGFIINEILTNSFKHAFKGRKNGIIHINVINKKNKIEFTVSDNGIGIPNEFNIEKTNSYGTELIHTLVMQLNGTIEVKNKNGTEINLLIPKH